MVEALARNVSIIRFQLYYLIKISTLSSESMELNG